jgi:hypothetical protein
MRYNPEKLARHPGEKLLRRSGKKSTDDPAAGAILAQPRPQIPVEPPERRY